MRRLFLACLVIGCGGSADASDVPDAIVDSTAAIDAAPTDTATSDASDASTPKPNLLFGVVEEQLAVCFTGQSYPCAALGDDETRRKKLAAKAPGLTVRWGGYETERTGLGYGGEAARRAFENVSTAGGQLEPSWLIARAKLAGYAASILAIPVTTCDAKVPGGARAWTADDARKNLDLWKSAIDASGFPPPAFVELGNEPWNHAAGEPDGFKSDPAGYVAKAKPIAEAVREKIQAFGWRTRIAVVVDNWPGTHFESATSSSFPTETIALARSIAINGPPVLQTHAYPLHGGYWCPKPRTDGDHEDVACAWALHVMLKKIKALAPDADLVLTEDNFDANTYPRAGVYTTLAALLTYAAGGVAYTHFGNNNYSHTGDRYELFDGLEPVPLVDDLARIQSLVKDLHPGDVTVTSSGDIPIVAGGYEALTGKKTAPAKHVFALGGKKLTVDVAALTVTVE